MPRSGNPFGRGGARWMPANKLRALAAARLTLQEIAEANERSEGWKPSRSAVSVKLREIGFEPRHFTHRDLIPWRVKPVHRDSLIRHMLGAESRARAGGELSETDRKLTARLHELLFGRGTLMVVTYHPGTRSGFSLVLREDSDDDIVRVDDSPKGEGETLAG